jgi:hypothetical protein
LSNNSNRNVLIGIVGIPILVIVLSSVLYFLVNSKSVDLGTVNNGTLVQPPLALAEQSIFKLSGERFDYSKPEPKWAFVVFAGEQCDEECAPMLYTARQSITALGKRMGRVRLIYVTTTATISEQLQTQFDTEYRGMDVVVMDSAALVAFFADSDIDPLNGKQFFVADPRGWLMMQYQVEQSDQDSLNVLGKAVVRDMKRLIK